MRFFWANVHTLEVGRPRQTTLSTATQAGACLLPASLPGRGCCRASMSKSSSKPPAPNRSLADWTASSDSCCLLPLQPMAVPANAKKRSHQAMLCLVLGKHRTSGSVLRPQPRLSFAFADSGGAKHTSETPVGYRPKWYDEAARQPHRADCLLMLCSGSQHLLMSTVLCTRSPDPEHAWPTPLTPHLQPSSAAANCLHLHAASSSRLTAAAAGGGQAGGAPWTVAPAQQPPSPPSAPAAAHAPAAGCQTGCGAPAGRRQSLCAAGQWQGTV